MRVINIQKAGESGCLLRSLLSSLADVQLMMAKQHIPTKTEEVTELQKEEHSIKESARKELASKQFGKTFMLNHYVHNQTESHG